jgi:hypothetical protein
MTKLYTATGTIHRGKTFVSVPAKCDDAGRPTCEGCAFNPSPAEETMFQCEEGWDGLGYIAVPYMDGAEPTEHVDEISDSTVSLMASMWELDETLGRPVYDFNALETAWFQQAEDVLDREEKIYNKHQLWNLPIMVNGYTFKKTCVACPEQYDVFVGDTQVAYVRLRHSKLKCVVPDIGGIEVYSKTLDGDDVGIFPDAQRFYYLNECADAITQFCVSGRDSIADRMARKLLY